MKKERMLDLRDLITATVNNLICITVDVKRQLIIIEFFGKRVELQAEEIYLCSARPRDFINYLKEKIVETLN